MSVNGRTATATRLDDDAVGFLLDLLDTPAPSGFEGPAADAFARYGNAFAGVSTDPVGNVTATVNAGASRRVALVGHLDEIGFIVTGFNSHGQLAFEGIGGWDTAVPVGQRVRVLAIDGVRIGTVGRLATHQIERGDRRLPELKDLWIDIGAADRDAARELVRIGDPVVMDARPHAYPNRRVMSRSADNRLGCFVALEAARRCIGLDVEVVAVGVVCEETSGHGARTAAWSLRPDEACVIDVTPTSDVPGTHEEDVVVDGGPVITFGATTRARIGAELVDAAGRAGIAVQLNGAGTLTYTDADETARAGSGVPSGLVSIPTRYLHTPGELFSLDDVEATIDLLAAWIRSRASS